MKRSDVPGRERSKLGGNFIEYGMLVLGALVLSYAFNALLAPNQIASGGVTGVSILFERLLGWEPAFSQWCINIPLFILGYFLWDEGPAGKPLWGLYCFHSSSTSHVMLHR